MRSAVVLALALAALGVRARADAADALLLGRVNAGTYETRADGSLLWPGRYFGIARNMDWSAYDDVEVTAFNPGARAIAFSFEVEDADSRDYWTRVNLSRIIAPGLQTIRLPTRLRVGETGRPGRPLDASRVVSLILSRADANDREPVEIRRIELKKSAKADVPGLRAFHVGPADAGSVDGFETLDENAAYDPARGAGWLSREFWAPYPQVNRVIAPDRLTSSNLTIKSAALRVDLKPGRYRVWMIVDHPGGFWGEYPYYRRRTVRAQGRLALDERMTPEQAKDAYFRWQDAEDREGDDLFERYWSQIIKEKTFDVRVGAGHLDLSFANEDCPQRLPCFGLALSALAVYPIDTAAQRAAGENWLRRLRESRRAEFDSQHQLRGRPLTALLASLPAGLVVRDAPPDLDLSRAAPADLRSFAEMKNPPRVAAFRNARAYFAPAVSWKGDSPRKIRWRVTGLPPGVRVEGGWIKYRALRDSDVGNLYSVRERWATDDATRAFAREDLGRLWLRFVVPADARPGTFPATLALSAGGAQPDVRVPFELRVFKARAADLDFPVGPFYDDVAEDWWDEAYLRPRLARLEEKSLLKLRERGFTAFSFRPRLRVDAALGAVAVDAREVDRVMARAKRLGFLGLVGYDDVFAGEDLCVKARPDDALAGADVWRRAFDALEAQAKRNDWLPLALIVCDEPVGERVGELLDRLRELPPPDPRRRVQWSVTTSLGREATPETRELVRRVGLPFLAGFAPEDLEFPWAYYNAASRDSLGLGMFRLRETTDLRDRLLWTWNANSANPYFDFDGRESDYAWCSSKEDESLRCSVGLDRDIDRGLTDYRVALGLKRLLERRKDLTPPQADRGRALLREARAPGADPDAWLLKAGEFEENL